MEDGCARSISSFNFEASKINWWTWLKESWGYSWLKLTKPYVVSAFLLDTLTSKHAIWDKVENFLDDARYIYKASSVLSPFKENMAPVIQMLVNKTWFQGEKDDGIMHPEFFEDEMLSLSTIALVLTIVSLSNCFPLHC